jgi:hypothetical protein
MMRSRAGGLTRGSRTDLSMIVLTAKWTEPERLRAIEDSTERLLEMMVPPPGPACVWCLLDVVWPGLARSDIAAAKRDGVELALVPLSRLGQVEGQSGSYVLFGRLRSKHAARPSNMLVIKTRKRNGSGVGLDAEWTAALAAKPHTYDRKDSFAIPLHFDPEDSRCEVLWSLCLPTVRESEGDEIAFDDFRRVDDLRSLIALQPKKTPAEAAKDLDHAAEVLKNTYRMLRSLHRTSASANSHKLARDTRSFGVEYEWYLRGYDSEGGGRWGPEWADVWAPRNEPRVGDGTNPLWLVERVRALSASMQVGLVHGDLHAGNIILRQDDVPAIIDFGWSSERAHVARDFALMECNLRFVTLRPQVGEAELESFSSALAWKPVREPALSGDLAARWGLVKIVRDAARAVFADDTDWSREYLVPLFLVAFGLLRFARQIGNQRAAVLTVERLAELLGSSPDLPELRT